MTTYGRRYQVFSIQEAENDAQGAMQQGQEAEPVWVQAGDAWVNRDGSLNVYLDTLPRHGRLHMRPVSDFIHAPLAGNTQKGLVSPGEGMRHEAK